MLRLGKITSINHDTGEATITDINDQEIDFPINLVSSQLILLQSIWFDIYLTPRGLEVYSITFFSISRQAIKSDHSIASGFL